MQRVEYQPLIVGTEPVDEPNICHYSFQDVTFVISLVVQLCADLLFVTLGIGNLRRSSNSSSCWRCRPGRGVFVPDDWRLVLFRKMTFGVGTGTSIGSSTPSC